MKRLILITIGIALVLNTPLSAQQASQNIPVLPVIPESDGADWYLRGDGYLQRQVEPTIAVSTRNPDHVLSFFVDYRAVDVGNDIGLGEETQTFALAIKTTTMMLAGLIPLPEIPFIESPPVAASEAWVGGSASHDGGMTWSGFFMPGASFDHSVISEESPVYLLEAATDPVAVAGPCGYVYVAFMAFTRGAESKLVVARFQDLNDSESGKTWQYQGAWELESGNNATNGYFLDKPHIALDIFRDDSDFSTYGPNFSADQCGHRVYTSYSTFNGLDKDGKFQSKLNFAASMDAGQTWDKSRIQQPYTQNQGSFIAVDPRPGQPKSGGGGSVYLVWRHFSTPDAIVMIKTLDYGKKWSKPIELTAGNTAMQPFDQPTMAADAAIPPSPEVLSFRSNAFPTAAVTPRGENGTVFVAWQEFVGINSTDTATYGLPKPYDETEGNPSSPRIVMVKSSDGGSTWTERIAVDIDPRDQDPTKYPPPGFGALPQARNSGPQVKPWLSFGGGKLALGYTESRGMYRRDTDELGFPTSPPTWNYDSADLSGFGFISGIERVMDFRVALLDSASGEIDESIQVSRYPIRYTASFGLNDHETVDDVASVLPELCAETGLPEYCQPSLNFVNKNHSGDGSVPFMGDYPGLSPVLPFVFDGSSWRWANNPWDVPYPAFHAVFADNRHLIPPRLDPDLPEWKRYSNYSYPTAATDYECKNLGSRNTDVLTAKVNAELILSAPTTYKKGSPGDPTWGYPITIFNRRGTPRFYQLEIAEPARFEDASFVVDPLNEEYLEYIEEGGDPESPYRGVVQIFPYSSTSQMVYVRPGATDQILVKVYEAFCDIELDENDKPVVDEFGEYEYNCYDISSDPVGYVTLNPDPTNPELPDPYEEQIVNIKLETIEEYYPTVDGDLNAINPFVRNTSAENPFVRNPFVRNPFVRNSAIEDKTVYKVVDTTWSIQATADSGAGSYLPVINIDNSEEFLKNYAFQLLTYKNASHGTILDCDSDIQAVNVPHTQIISSVTQEQGAQNPFVRNPFVRNPFVRNPFVRNPFVRNSAITVAPADGIFETDASSAQPSAKNLIDDEGNLRVPRVPEKIYITLRAFQIGDNPGQFEFNPYIDEPAISAVPTRCTSQACIKSLSPDLIPDPDSIVVAEPDFADLPDRTPPVDPEGPDPVPVEVPLGATITFDFTLVNQGTVQAEAEDGEFRHAFFLSADAKVDLEVDVYGDHIPINNDIRLDLDTGVDPPKFIRSLTHPLPPKPIEPNDTSNTEPFSGITVEIPDDIDLSNDYQWLILFVDDYREVSENNEPNNQYAMRVNLVKLNHAPTITASELVEVLEDSGPYAETWATGIDDGEPDEEQELWIEELTVDIIDSTLSFDVEPAIEIEEDLQENLVGTLSFDLADNAYGQAQVTVKLMDGGADGDTVPGSVNFVEKSFTLSVLPVNDAPSFVPTTGSFNIEVDEDAESTTFDWATEVSPGPYEYPPYPDSQTVTFVIESVVVDNPVLFNTTPPVAISPDGTLSFALTENAFGTATVTVFLQDNGGNNPEIGDLNRTEPSLTFTITITPVRDYDFLGLFDPWNAHPVYTAKVGSAIPLKWQYAQNGVVVDTGDLFPRVMVRGPFDCGWDSLDPAEPPPTPPDTEPTWVEYTPLNFPGASDYRYSESSGTWQFNWDTDGLGEGCYNAYVINDTVYETDGPFRIKLK